MANPMTTESGIIMTTGLGLNIAYDGHGNSFEEATLIDLPMTVKGNKIGKLIVKSCRYSNCLEELGG